ncbi:hypothetical protein EV677_1497 [Herminiimonas fonticola]|uniref:Uncharacterized protein n=1 Tax=Herminiimonas fonticola TaxID=303380 RepID=A0A4R6GKR0_9BURK|nr:hypothetical protein Hfont_1459 [Herminiimonas fonticola]TDN94934.1 hypothetical protein EV677_1497 [Herminiimonas fonticola]
MINEFKRWRPDCADMPEMSTCSKELDEGGWLVDIDKTVVRQEAMNLMRCIETDENLAIACVQLPEILLLIGAALDGSLRLPFKGPTPCSVDLVSLRASLASNRQFRFGYYRFISIIRGERS